MTCAANAVRLEISAGLKSRQFRARAGDAGADQKLVADEPEQKADQNWCEGREPRARAGLIMANPQHPQRIISLSRVLPPVRIVNVAGGRHRDAEKACPMGQIK
jgi:hypothetical protein